jgi:hypothetical protein
VLAGRARGWRPHGGLLGSTRTSGTGQASTHLARRSAGKAMANRGLEEKPIHAPSVVRSLELEFVTTCRV